MEKIAWVLLVMSVFEIVFQPFVIGKERKPLSSVGYVINLVSFALVLVLSLSVITN